MTARALWVRWCAGPYRPRRMAQRPPASRALRVAGVIGWWAIPFILIDGLAVLLLVALN